MHQVDASNPSPSERVRRGMRRIALVVAVPAAFLALGDLVMAIYFSDPAHWQSARWFAAFAIGWFVFWIALSWVVRGFMQD
jgi:hypothetical protein